jgi:hypothetical protein
MNKVTPPETDKEKRERYLKALETHEAEAEAIKTAFVIDDFVSDVETVREVEIEAESYVRQKQIVEKLISEGATEYEIQEAISKVKPEFKIVKYKRLTNEDIIKLNRIKDVDERGMRTIHLLLSRADPSITIEKVKAMGTLATGRITLAIQDQTPLFLI